MRLLLVLTSAAALAWPAAALAGGVPGWVYGMRPTASGPYLDFAFEGRGDGAHPWEVDYHAPCDGHDRGTAASESFSIHSYPTEKPLRMTHGRFVLRRHYDIGGMDIRFTLRGHRVGKRLVGTFLGTVQHYEGGHGGRPRTVLSNCTTRTIRWTAHRDVFKI